MENTKKTADTSTILRQGLVEDPLGQLECWEQVPATVGGESQAKAVLFSKHSGTATLKKLGKSQANTLHPHATANRKACKKSRSGPPQR